MLFSRLVEVCKKEIWIFNQLIKHLMYLGEKENPQKYYFLRNSSHGIFMSNLLQV